MARKSTSPAPRRRSSRPSLGTTPKKFTYSAIGETTVDADEKAAALAHEAALLKAREARVARDNAEADAAETGPLYLAMGQAAAISAAGEAFCALAIKGESLDAYRLGVFASFSALLTAALMPWLAVLAQAEMHPLMKTAVDSCVQIPLISASFIAYFEIVLGGGALAAQLAVNAGLNRALSCGPEDYVRKVSSLQVQAKAADKAHKQISKELADQVARGLRAAAGAAGGGQGVAHYHQAEGGGAWSAHPTPSMHGGVGGGLGGSNWRTAGRMHISHFGESGQ